MANTFGGFISKADKAQQRTMYAKEQQTRLNSILQTTKAPLKIWDELEPKLFVPEKPTPDEPHWDPKPVKEEKIYQREDFSIEEPKEEDFFSTARQREIYKNIFKYLIVIVLVVFVLIFSV